MNQALEAQVGGDHYKGAIQPFQLSMANGHDSCTHAIQKYLTRFPKKGRVLDLQKAHHICMIRFETMADYGQFVPHPPSFILIGDYLRSNKIKGPAAAAIVRMEQWFRTVYNEDVQRDMHMKNAEAVRRLIRSTAEKHYPETYDEKDFI